MTSRTRAYDALRLAYGRTARAGALTSTGLGGALVGAAGAGRARSWEVGTAATSTATAVGEGRRGFAGHGMDGLVAASPKKLDQVVDLDTLLSETPEHVRHVWAEVRPPCTRLRATQTLEKLRVQDGSLKATALSAKSRGGGSPLLRSGAMLPAGCGWCVQAVAKTIGHGGHTLD
jgi:predicted RNA-binding Zn ribbon-like protein